MENSRKIAKHLASVLILSFIVALCFYKGEQNGIKITEEKYQIQMDSVMKVSIENDSLFKEAKIIMNTIIDANNQRNHSEIKVGQ